jgi:transcriptional regulator with XRE-family HTH domain
VEDPDLGRQLRALRTAAGRTVASVAEDAGLSVPYIANLENSRGNPTTAALTRLAAALGQRLTISLAPIDAEAGHVAPPPPAEPSASLVRLARTPRFQRATRAMAAALGQDPSHLSAALIPALAQLAAALNRDPADPDWWRLLDALLLVTMSPA